MDETNQKIAISNHRFGNRQAELGHFFLAKIGTKGKARLSSHPLLFTHNTDPEYRNGRGTLIN